MRRQRRLREPIPTPPRRRHRRPPLSRGTISDGRRDRHGHRRPVQAARGDRRGRHGLGLPGRADRAGQARGRAKLIKTGMDSRAVLARFEAERQALALMDHPNIARSRRRPHDRAASRSSSWSWSRACRSPSTATRSGSRCRPGSSCSCRSARRCSTPTRRGSSTATSSRATCWSPRYDDQPVPKVIDFGVAKATEQQLTEQSFARHRGDRGHAAYMSPEQADRRRWTSTPGPTSMRWGDALRAADRLAADRRQAVQAGRPSWRCCGWSARWSRRGRARRLSTADALPSIAANRSIEPRRLTTAAAGRARLGRDEGAGEGPRPAVRDGQRLRAATCSVPATSVEARPPSRGYRLRKFVKRNKGR